jgi:hypothetical protein
LTLVGVGRDEEGHAVGGQGLHLDGVPVTGVGESHVGRLLDAGGQELAAGGANERPELPEVTAARPARSTPNGSERHARSPRTAAIGSLRPAGARKKNLA